MCGKLQEVPRAGRLPGLDEKADRLPCDLGLDFSVHSPVTQFLGGTGATQLEVGQSFKAVLQSGEECGAMVL